MKTLAILALFLASIYSQAQTAVLYYAFTATATGGYADTSLAPQVDALNVRINGINTSETWTAQIETSPDNATWTDCGSAVSATAASSSSGGACTPAGAAFVRVLITSGGGTGNVTGALMGTCSLCQVAGGGGGTTDTIASGTATLGTSAIASEACATAVTVSASGVESTDSIIWTPNTSIKAVTGYAPSTSGGLSIASYPTSGDVSFDVCNWSAGSITPGAVTLNWRVVR